MGISVTADIFQAYVAGLFLDMEVVLVYIDDLLIFSPSTLKDHLHLLQTVFQQLWEANLQVNAEKSHFCIHEVEYLG